MHVQSCVCVCVVYVWLVLVLFSESGSHSVAKGLQCTTMLLCELAFTGRNIVLKDFEVGESWKLSGSL